jgi:hypothetical protein
LQHMQHENGRFWCGHFQNYIVVSIWWGRQDSNLRRHSQRIYSPPPLPLGTLPQSRRTVLISKDNRVRPPAGQVASVLCGSYPCQVNGAAACAAENKKSRRWERRLFSTATCGATRYTSGTTLWSIRQNRTGYALRTASPSVSTLLLNYFKYCRRSNFSHRSGFARVSPKPR